MSVRITLLIIILLVQVNILCASQKVVFSGIDKRGDVSESLRRGTELVLADALQKQGLVVYGTDDIQLITASEVYRADITGEANLAFWCKRVDADRGLFSVISKDGKDYELTLYVVDPQTQKVVYAARADFEGVAADEAALRVADRVASYLRENVIEFNGPTKEGFYVRSLVPGLAQSYYGHHVKGRVFQLVFGLGLVATGVSYGNYAYRREIYDNYNGGPEYPGDTAYIDKMDRKRGDMRNAFTVYQLCAVGTGVFWLYNFIDAYSFSFWPAARPPKQPWNSAYTDSPSLSFSPLLFEIDSEMVPGLVLNYRF